MINKAPIITGHSPEPVAGIMSSGPGHKNTTITTTTVTTHVDTVTIDTSNSNTTTTSESVPGVPVPGPGPVGVGHGIGSSVPQVANAESESVTGTGTGIHNGNISVTGISSDHGAGISSSALSSSQQQQQQQDGLELNTTAGKDLNTTPTTVEDKTDSVTNNNTSNTPDQQQDIIPLRAKPAPHQPDHSEDHPIDHPGHHPEDPQQHPGDPSDDPQAQAEPSESNHNHYPGHCLCARQPAPGAQPPASSLPSTYIKSSPLTSDTPNAYGLQGGDLQQDSTTIQPHIQHPPNMIFSDLYKSPRSPLNKLRQSFPHHQPPVVLPPDLDADLVSKDKAKQKEAVRKFLSEKIRNDWEFEWPPVTQSQSESPTETTPISNENQEKGDIAQQPPSDDTVAPKEHGLPRIAAETETAVVETCDDAIALQDPGEVADSESDAESIYSTISEDLVHYRPRAEWTSDLSGNDEPKSAAAAAATSSSSPFRFDNPDAVGTAVKCSLEAKRAKRRRAVRDEASWNPGLACFEARRNAWTGAKTVRVKPKPTSPASPSTERSSTTRRLSFWRHHKSSESTSAAQPPVGSPPAPTNLTAPLSPTTTRTSQQSAQSDAVSDTSARGTGTGGGNATDTTAPSTSTTSSAVENHSSYPVQTLLPLPPPLLPPQNPMRASVTPSIYPSLYDKIIINNMQPSCPVNLSDMLRACVVGWKRDGEWPPKSQYTNVAAPPMPVPKPMTAAEIAAQRQRKVTAAKHLQAQKEMRERVAREAEEVRERAREAARVQREERERQAKEQREAKEERERLEKQEKEREKAEKQAEKMRRKSDATTQAHQAATQGGRDGRRSSIVALVGGVVNHLTRVPTAEDRERGSQESDENNGGGRGGIRRSLQKVFSLGHGGHNAHQGGHAA